jgi:LGFP repeat
MPIQILRTRMSHVRTTPQSLFNAAGTGVDTFSITVPPNHTLFVVQLNILKVSGRATATLASTLPAGFTGTGVVTVRWTTAWPSEVSYELVALANKQCQFQAIGLIRDKWTQLGAENGPLGCALMNETPTREIKIEDKGRYNDFEGGSIYWHPRTSSWHPVPQAYMVTGLIRDKWKDLDAEMSILGYPVTDETDTPDRTGRYNHFEHGSIYWTPATGAVEVWGGIRERWAELRWERGFLGYPVSSPVDVQRSNGLFKIARFQGGEIELNVATQEVHVRKFPSIASPNYEVLIRGYRVTDSNGARPCNITVLQAGQWVDEANRIFAAAGVLFRYDNLLPDLADDNINNLPADNAEAYANWIPARDRLNQLATTQGAVIMAYRHGPGNGVGGGFSSPGYNFAVMSFFDQDALSILAHELGHHFGLGHTHGRKFETIREASDYILSGGSIEQLDPDRSDNIHDTPADPFIPELDNLARTMRGNNNAVIHSGSRSVNAVTAGGVPLALARKNIMSYWNRYTGTGRTEWGQLTHDQIDRVREFVARHRNTYLNVTEIVR